MRMSRMIVAAVAASVLGAGCGPSRAETGRHDPPEGIVWYVLSVLNRMNLDIEDPTNRPPVLHELPDGVLTAVDVSPDGKPDWLIVWPEDAPFCGTGGCRHTLYVSTSDGFARAFDRQAFDLDIRRVGQSTRLEAKVHPIYCGDDRPDCRLVWWWDGDAESLYPAPDQAGDPLPPVDPDVTG